MAARDVNDETEQRRAHHVAALVAIDMEGLGAWLADKAGSIAGTGRLWILQDGRSFLPQCISWRLNEARSSGSYRQHECVQSGWQLIPAGEVGLRITRQMVWNLWHSGEAARGWSSGRALTDEDRRRLRKALGDELMDQLEASKCEFGTIWDRWSEGG